MFCLACTLPLYNLVHVVFGTPYLHPSTFLKMFLKLIYNTLHFLVCRMHFRTIFSIDIHLPVSINELFVLSQHDPATVSTCHQSRIVGYCLPLMSSWASPVVLVHRKYIQVLCHLQKVDQCYQTSSNSVHAEEHHCSLHVHAA